MNPVTSLGVYILAFLAALLIVMRWLPRHDPMLRADEPVDAKQRPEQVG